MGCEAEGLTPLAGEWVGSSGVMFYHSFPRLHSNCAFSDKVKKGIKCSH